MKTIPTLAITLGDPNGIGPEIILKTFAREDLSFCRPFVIGDMALLQETQKRLFPDSPLQMESIDNPDSFDYRKGTLPVLNLHTATHMLECGYVCAWGGQFAYDYMDRAITLAQEKRIDGIVTAPISKEALKLAGLPYPGHTEILLERTGTKEWAMTLARGNLRVLHLSGHKSLKDALQLITKENLLKTIRLAHQTAKELGLEQSRIGVAGLNPHAGEGGLFGDEEKKEIIPAVEAAKAEGINVEGPIAPDAIFIKGLKGEFDLIVALYHDQGHIPIKLLGIEKAVQLTVGLPFVRTSVAHGTAFDIAGKGIAKPDSLIEAIKLAARMVTLRQSA